MDIVVELKCVRFEDVVAEAGASAYMVDTEAGVCKVRDWCGGSWCLQDSRLVWRKLELMPTWMMRKLVVVKFEIVVAEAGASAYMVDTEARTLKFSSSRSYSFHRDHVRGSSSFRFNDQ